MPVYLFDASQLHPDDMTGILIKETKMVGWVNEYPVRRWSMPTEMIDMYAKNNRTFRVFVKTPELNIVDLTGAVGILTVKSDENATTAVITKSTATSGQGQIGAADEGEMFFFLVPNDTTGLDIRQYVFDVKVTLSNGKVYTTLNGILNLMKPVG